MSYRIAVVGATGAVGREILTTLAEREFPASDVAAIASERTNDEQASRADVSISPGVGDTYWSDFHNLDAHVEAGERAAREKLGEVRGLVARLGRG